MAKLKGPLFSLQASGQLSETLSYVQKGNNSSVRAFPKLKTSRPIPTTAQQFQRLSYSSAVKLWGILPDGTRDLYNDLGSLRGLTGFNIFVSEYLKGQPVGQGLKITNVNELLMGHSVRVDLNAGDVDGFTDFDDIRFYQGTEMLASWKQEDDGTDAVFWVRIPFLPTGVSMIVFNSSADTQVSLSGRALAEDASASLVGDGYNDRLKTATKENDTVSEMTTVHPKVVVADGWMTDGGAYDRVLIDTPWTKNPPAGHVANEYENPSIWVRRVSDGKWVWPNLSGFPAANNEIHPTPASGNSSDPTAVWIKARSMPNYGGVGVAGPATDTLMIFYRHNDLPSGEDSVHMQELISYADDWADMHSDGDVLTTLRYVRGSDAAIENRFISPGVVQNADGSLSMWCVRQNTSGYRLTVERYNSEDGVNWVSAGDCVIERPVGMYAPYHLDVFLAGTRYFLIASAGQVRSDSSDSSPYECFMWHSDDGFLFTLDLPSVISVIKNEDATAHWYVGAYRPSGTYLGAGSGLELYIGSDGAGTGGWSDATWDPLIPRTLPETIAAVFWLPSRDFNVDFDAWPWPLNQIFDATYGAIAAVASGALHLETDGTKSRSKVDAVMYAPTDHEFHIRQKCTAPDAVQNEVASNQGIIYDKTNAQDIRAMFGGTGQLNWTDVTAGGREIDVTVYHIFKSRRKAGFIKAWVDDLTLDTVGDGSGATETTISGGVVTDVLGIGLVKRAGTTATVDVDWFFFRDPLEDEPSVELV